MGRYRGRDLVSPPGLLSLARIPLAAAFPFVVDEPPAAFAVLVAAAASDVLDGWWARRFGLVTPTGAALDGVTDKLFALTVAVTLVVRDLLTPLSVLLLSTREVAELPLVVWIATHRPARQARASQPHANVAGKAATILQYAVVVSALLRGPHTAHWVAVTAAAGAVAAVTYWVRAVRAYREGRGA